MNKIICLLLASSCIVACKVDFGPSNKNQDGGSEDEPPFPDQVSPINLPTDAGSRPDGAIVNVTPSNTDGVKNGEETDVDCGGPNGTRCGLGKNCNDNFDCAPNFCSHSHVCFIDEKSCLVHFGGDTCGAGEVGDINAKHESCCKSLPVSGFTDYQHPGKKVYLDKYEITAGRVRAFITDVTKQMGRPDVKLWIRANRPIIWDDSWTEYLPSDYEGNYITINRLLLGDPRHDGQTPEQAGPGVIIPPAADQSVSLGLNRQFGGQVYADLHGNNCGTYAGAYGFPTWYYPDAVQIKNGEKPRTLSKDVLDTKSMNCITNAMLAAFCAWDNAQLATTQVMDFVADNQVRNDAVSGCGTQYDNHGALLGNNFDGTIQSGGRCNPVSQINATFDAGDNLPEPGSFLNHHNYNFPFMGNVNSDKVWQIAAPGRVVADFLRAVQGAEPWMDIAGNLSESVYNPATGRFGIRFRGIGYGSSRSDLNVTFMPGENVLRVQRPEAKTALVGGRCMRFK